MLLKKLRQAPLVLLTLVAFTGCDRAAEPHSAIAEHKAVASTLRLMVDRSTIAYLADHGIYPMIGTGPCGQDKASVWYVTDILDGAGTKFDDPGDALHSSAGARFALSAVMEYPRPAATDDCAYLTSAGYSLFGLRAKSVPLQRVGPIKS